MKSKRAYCCLLVATGLLVLSVTPLLAQSGNTAALTGTVTDQTGGSVPGATVTVTNTGTNQTRSVTTSADGVYRVPLLEPGVYRVRFTADGFKVAEASGVTLVVTETAVLDRAMEVGAQTEQISVEANVETVQTATSTIGTTVTGNAIAALPLSARNFTQVLGMSTGVAVALTNGTSFGRGSQNMSVNGAQPEKNNFQMDGVAINNSAGNNAAGDAGLYTGIAIPNPDSIQEFKIQTSTYDASFGRNPGANVNVVTKSGTNAFHGTLFEYFRNEKLNANDFFYNRDSKLSQTQKQVLKQNQFGGVLGGPIKKDQLFFFGSYQGTRQINGVAAQGSSTVTLFPIPGDREKADFQQRLGAAMCGFTPAVPSVPIACDGSTINPVAVALLRVKLKDGSYYIPGSGTAGTRQEFISIPGKYTEDQYIANVDWIVSAKHSVQMKYMFSNNPFTYSGSGLFGQLPGRVQSDRRSNTSAVLRLTSILSPTVVNQARVSFQRIIQDGTDTVPYTPQEIGLTPMIDSNCCNGTTGGTYTQPPFMIVGGAFQLGGGLNPSFAPSNQTQWSDQVSWTRGTHTMRAGFEYENVRYPLVFGGLGRGFLIIPSFADLLIGRASCAPGTFPTTCNPDNPGIDPRGHPTNGGPVSNLVACLFCVRSGVGGIIHNYHLKNISAYFQDDWKVNSRLTLNLGVRWEYDGTLSDKYGNLTNLWASDLRSVPIPPSAANDADARANLTNNPLAYTGYVVPNNYDSNAHGPLPPGVRQFDGEFASQNSIPLSNFGPRIGFAWQPLDNGRLVIRGGAGLFYDRVGINRLVHAVQEGKPYADTTTIQNEIASLQSPFQDRPLAFAPRWFNFSTLTGSSFDSPYYDRIQTPLVRQYNLGIQYEFAPSYVLEAAFVGSSGINVADYSHNVNAAQLVCTSRVTTNCVSGGIHGITTNTASNTGGRVPYLGFTPTGLQQNAFDGVYNYNSLQITVRKQFSHGFGFQSSYTWSKNLSTMGYDAANLNLPNDLGQQYGQTPYSRPHVFNLSYQWELPFRSTGLLDKLVGGWAVNGSTTIQSGNPMTFFDNRGGSVFGTVQNSIEKGYVRAQFCPGSTFDSIATSGDVKSRLGGASGGPGFFNINAFCAPPVLGDDGTSTGFGNTGVGIARGPHQLNFDFSASKTTKIGERQSVQFRAEFFNIFNHTQFFLPSYPIQNNAGSFVNSPGTFGVINSTSVNPRLIQLALRYQF